MLKITVKLYQYNYAELQTTKVLQSILNIVHSTTTNASILVNIFIIKFLPSL